jgi:demethylmenaquinone methyltransferase/2-methoxy-6-polyprenyl-1,4-benzoquinol methylase
MAQKNDILPVLQSKEERRKFYNKIASVYDLLAEKSEQPIRDAALKLLRAQPGEQILEIGFGTGHCLVEIAEAVGPDGKAYGLDISEKMVELTRELLKSERLSERVELHQGDAENMPFASDSLDAVFMSFTLELFDIPEIPRVLAECWRALEPGGRLVVAALSKDAGPGAVIKVFEWTHAHFPNLMDCRPIHVRQAIEDADFAIGRVQQERVWVPVEIVMGIK